MTKKQLFASNRNHQLMRLTGFFLREEFLSGAEKIIYNKAKNLLDLLKEDWDDNSSDLGLNIKPYKCSLCGKRSDKEYIYKDGRNYCHKHFKEYTDYDSTNTPSTREV